jgi:hypothetical protein
LPEGHGNMTTDEYKRDDEIENNVQLMKMLYDLALFEGSGARRQRVDCPLRELAIVFDGRLNR